MRTVKRILAVWSEDYERQLCEALAEGAAARGMRCDLLSFPEWKNEGKRPKADAVVIVSMNANRVPIYRHFRDAGLPVLYIDKGYVRLPWDSAVDVKTKYWRFAVNGVQPDAYLAGLEPDVAKWLSMGVPLEQGGDGDCVLLAGSTNRYHSWYGLPEPKPWAMEVLTEIRRHFRGTVLWRPKPSQFKRGIAFDLPGCETDRLKHGLPLSLRRARLLVTHGSAIACNAVWAGVPAVTLGPSVANPVTSRSVLQGLTDPVRPGERELLEWCGRLAACQYTLAEMRRGAVWDHFTDALRLLGEEW
jgi:hypothetical protein